MPKSFTTALAAAFNRMIKIQRQLAWLESDIRWGGGRRGRTPDDRLTGPDYTTSQMHQLRRRKLVLAAKVKQAQKEYGELEARHRRVIEEGIRKRVRAAKARKLV